MLVHVFKIRHPTPAMTDVRLVKIKNNRKYRREIKGCPMHLVISP
jgi:hypothetical protein